MRIWSIQSETAWHHLEQHGVLRASEAHWSNMLAAAYEWMRTQLAQRIGPPARPDMVPLWGWYQWAGTSRKRPDLRSLRHNWGAHDGKAYVLIECELPDDDVLLSDHDAWHVPLNDGYLGLDQYDCDRFSFFLKKAGWKRGDPLPGELSQKRQESWGRIFDLNALNSEYWGETHQKSIQACFWQIEKDQVKSCAGFTARHRMRP